MRYLIALIFVFTMIPKLGAEEIRLKTEDQNEIIEISSFFQNSKSEFFLFSPKSGKIFKFKSNGDFEKTFCRFGEGPGEIKRVLDMFFNPFKELIYLPEFYSGRGHVSIFNTDGDFVGYLKIDLPQSKSDKIAYLYFFSDHSFITITDERVGWKPYGNLFITQAEVELKRFDAEGKCIANVYKGMYDDELSNAVNYGGPSILFKPHFIIRKTMNDQIAVNKNDENSIIIFDLDGKKQSSIALEIKKEKLSDGEFLKAKDNKIESLKHSKYPQMIELAKSMIKLTYKPIFSNIYFSPNEIIVVKIIESNEDGNSVKSKVLFFNMKGEKKNEKAFDGEIMNIINNRIFIKRYKEDELENFEIKNLSERN